MPTVKCCKRVTLPETADLRGRLMFAEEDRHIPFPVRRVFAIYQVPAGQTRGAHAHRTCHQFIVMLAGGSTISYGNMKGAAALAIGLWNAMSRMMSWAAGSFIFVDAGAFRELGGFDEKLFASEELELFKRLKRMARAKGRRLAILHRHPILTSDRKLRLYGWGELFRFTAKTILSRGRTLRRREDCAAWYDGRR